jgi:hypothetical protein
LDHDDNEEEEEEQEEEEQDTQPVARVERPAYVELMDYNESMGDILIPNNKVIRPINCWCYTNLDPMHWGENSIDGCPTYGVCQVCCGSGPTGRRCVICCVDDVLYVCMSKILKDGKGEEITRMIDD